jgi:hypothetical protein
MKTSANLSLGFSSTDLTKPWQSFHTTGGTEQAWVRSVNKGNLMRRYGTRQYEMLIFTRQDGF